MLQKGPVKTTMRLGFDNIIQLKFTTNFDRCVILNVLNCLTKKFSIGYLHRSPWRSGSHGGLSVLNMWVRIQVNASFYYYYYYYYNSANSTLI